MNLQLLVESIQNSQLNKFQIAEQSGISRTTLDNLLSGADAKISTLEAVCSTIGISPAILFSPSGNFTGQSQNDYIAEIAKLKQQLSETKTHSAKVVFELDVEDSEFIKFGLKDKIIKILEK